MASKWNSWFFPLRAISGFSEVDGTLVYYNVINSRIVDGSVVLDFGAGRGEAIEDPCAWRRSMVATKLGSDIRRIAVDIDKAVLGNPMAHENYILEQIDPLKIPLGDATVDVVICDWVVEHLPNPEEVFGEFLRVLKPGGMVGIRTSNKWNYAYLAARVFGNSRMAGWILKKVQPNRKEEDVFPKYYRSNSRRGLRKALARVGFGPMCVLTVDSEPAYVGQGFAGNLAGFIYHRCALLGLVPRGTLLGFAYKKM